MKNAIIIAIVAITAASCQKPTTCISVQDFAATKPFGEAEQYAAIQYTEIGCNKFAVRIHHKDGTQTGHVIKYNP